MVTDYIKYRYNIGTRQQNKIKKKVCCIISFALTDKDFGNNSTDKERNLFNSFKQLTIGIHCTR